MFAETSDAVAITTAILSLIGTMFAGLMAYLMARLAKVSADTHTLVNSAMGVQLKLSLVALRRVAEMTEHPDDIAAAELAEKSYREHQEKQAAVDARNKKVLA